MATLVLTAVGSLVGGPIGGAIGSVLGSSIDRSLFSPRRAIGPRLSGLAVQGSSYGAPIPKLFGTMRVAGTVIWATDLREETHKSGGKGQPRTTSYSYSASFAVALSSRPIRGVRRVWADGNLLRGAGGDWKGELAEFRLHIGGEGQSADPLIASAEGIGATPAYRGLAYAVFEGLALADFGNRIPSLSFEVEADAGPVTLAAIAAALSEGDVAGVGGPALTGYAADGDSVRGAIEALGRSLPVAFAGTGTGLRLADEDAPPVAIPAAALGAHAGERAPPRLTIERDATGTLNEALAIDYADPARDYQIGSQRARRGAAGRREGSIELPAAIDAAGARAIAEARLAREWAGAQHATLTLPPQWLSIAVGDIVTLPATAGRWRVTARTLEAFAVRIEAVRLPGAGFAPVASAGRATSEPDLAAGATTIALLDLPTIGDRPSDQPTLLVAAAGASAGWRRATVIGSIDGGETWSTIGRTAAGAVLGIALDALPAGAPALIDEVSSVEVELLSDAMMLAGDDRPGWSAERNLILIGDELVQFGAAELLGGCRWRLRRLLSGRRGTEWACADHAAGERVVLVDPDTLLAWPLPAAAIGATVTIAATGAGDAVPATATIRFDGRALKPPAPVHATAQRAPNGDVAIGWTRRSRAGWPWIDGSDAPLAEQAERYRVEISRGAGTAMVETDGPSLAIPAAALAAIGVGPATARIAQTGTFGASRAAIITLPTEPDR